MVPVAVVRTLVLWDSKLVNGGPLADSGSLLCTNAPICPEVSLALVFNRQGQRCCVKGHVFNIAIFNFSDGITLQTIDHSCIIGSTRYPVGLVGITSGPIVIRFVLSRWTRLGGVPQGRAIQWIEVGWCCGRPRRIRGIGDVQTRSHTDGARFAAGKLNTPGVAADVFGLQDNVEFGLTGGQGMLQQGRDVERSHAGGVDPDTFVERSIRIRRMVSANAQPSSGVACWVGPCRRFRPTAHHRGGGDEGVLVGGNGVEVKRSVHNFVHGRHGKVREINRNQ